MQGIGRLTQSQMINEYRRQIVFVQKIQIPTEAQILQMFEKNGFRENNVVTKNQLQELFDRQYAMNSMDDLEKQTFSRQLFSELWGHLQLLSDSTAKIDNIVKVLYDALTQLKKKLSLISGPRGISHKEKGLLQLLQKQKELSSQLDIADPDFHQQSVKSQLSMVRINMGKLQVQISQLQRDRDSFQQEFRMLIVTIGEHQSAPVETRFIQDGLMSLVGLQRKQHSGVLKFIFILTIICLSVELFVLSYRFSFFTLLGYTFLLYLLFLGYYTDKTVVYLMLYFILSILLDLGYVYLNMFTSFILNPVVFTYNTFLKYVAMVAILVSVIGRVILIVKLLAYKEIPKTLHYFQFWGEQVVLNRRNKQFSSVPLH